VLTPQGIVLVVAGVVAAVTGRVFGVLELFVIAAACFAAAAAAVLYVRLRGPQVTAARWIHPAVIVAGDTGRVDLHLHHHGRIPSAAFTLCEAVQRRSGNPMEARIPVDSMRREEERSTGYALPGAARGIIRLGPLEVEMRDPLGIARSAVTVAEIDEVTVAPRAYALDMPRLGRGALGAALLDRARRLGPGDFHGLREYADGDEPRSIHWKASARSDSLMVKDHAIEGLHRCTVVFDATTGAHADDAAFERGVTAAASLVTSAVRSGLATRFVTAGGVDLRGPEVAINSMRVLARIEPTGAPLPRLDREIGEGVGLTVVVTGSAQGRGWRAATSVLDPTMTTLLVATSDAGGNRLAVRARSEDEFVGSWQALAGRERSRIVEPVR
jgi:uncharacterized protein (DUF58 family)